MVVGLVWLVLCLLFVLVCVYVLVVLVVLVVCSYGVWLSVFGVYGLDTHDKLFSHKRRT